MLTPRQRQVLAYVRSWVDEEGFLPTTRDIATVCGLRSPSSARQVLAELEEAGYVERDPDHPRLAVVHDRAREDAVPGPDELLLCALTIVEIEASIAAAQQALAWAPDDDALEALHRRCLERLALLRAYREARHRIEAGGATLTADGLAAVDRHQRAVTERNTAIGSWDEFRVHVLLFDTLVGRFLDSAEEFGAAHLAVAYAAERGTSRTDRRLGLEDVDRRLVAGEPGLATFAFEHVTRLTEDCRTLLDSISSSLSATLQPASSAVLDAADTRRSQTARSCARSSIRERTLEPLASRPTGRSGDRHAN